ncbi:MAG: flagellar filament capping protein FliD [Candidatus Accumulibacter sp.]|jgi:flagellar hook-associated protein 2|nr:flagellar filament capping protein FliD [Accumulibacter sp.]
MAISSLGVGSGLDLETLITKLMQVERQPLASLQNRKTTYTSQISALGKIKSAIDSLKTAATAMKDPDKLLSLTANSADASVVSASASAGASTGTHSIEVTQLASAHKLVSPSSVNLSTGGTLTLETGSVSGTTFMPNGSAATVNIAARASLSDVASAINSAKAGVTATIVNGTGGQQLVVTSNTTGASSQIRMSAIAEVTGLSIAGLDFDPAAATPGGMTQQAAGQNAELKIDGIDVVSASNTVKDALAGVTLELKKTNSGAPTQLTISGDSSALREKAEAFVKEYNNVISTLKSLSQYNPDGVSGALNGDSTVRSLLSEIRNNAFNVPAGVDASFERLFSLGISTQTDGTLKLDAAKLDEAASKDISAAAKSLSAYATSFESLAKRLNGTGGLLETRTDSVQQSSRLLDTRIETMNLYLEKVEARYRKQFSALDSLMGKLRETSDYLAQQFSLLGNMSSSK